ncbi:MAG: hypothetical protein NTZ50_00310, partial [Chloroflexi bacterium]|nr:hypothetical protein [Chloroflexota bacterium]
TGVARHRHHSRISMFAAYSPCRLLATAALAYSLQDVQKSREPCPLVRTEGLGWGSVAPLALLSPEGAYFDSARACAEGAALATA